GPGGRGRAPLPRRPVGEPGGRDPRDLRGHREEPLLARHGAPAAPPRPLRHREGVLMSSDDRTATLLHDALVSAEPPLTLDPTVVRGLGTRAVRRRRLVRGGIAALATSAAVVALAVTGSLGHEDPRGSVAHHAQDRSPDEVVGAL